MGIGRWKAEEGSRFLFGEEVHHEKPISKMFGSIEMHGPGLENSELYPPELNGRINGSSPFAQSFTISGDIAKLELFDGRFLGKDFVLAGGASIELSNAILDLGQEGSITGSGRGSRSRGIGGRGKVVGNVGIRNTLVAPGESPGVLIFDGNYTQASNTVLEIELGGGNQIEQYDLLDVTGTATLDGGLIIKLIDDFVPQPEDSFTFVKAGGGVTGSFINITQTGVGNELVFELEYGPNSVIAIAKAVSQRTYETWRTETFTAEEAADDQISGPGANGDDDELINLWEYVSGFDPKEPNWSSFQILERDEIGEGGQYVVLRFPWVVGTSDATYTIESTNDLQNPDWTEQANEVLGNEFTDGMNFLIVRVDLPAPIFEKTFLRLRVELPDTP